MNGCVALVVAAGRGHRFGGGLPKQYCLLAGRPVLRHSLEAFLDHPGIDHVMVVIHPDDTPFYQEAAEGLPLLDPVFGGATRQESVLHGLAALSHLGPDRVLIHDGARPLVDPDTISRVLAALDGAPAAVPALPVSDTLKREDGGFVAGTVDRARLWRAQTPQGFHFDDILAAHLAAEASIEGLSLTDDAAVAEHAGLKIAIVLGDEDNIKMTTADDLARAERILATTGDVRVGTGFDVHRFAQDANEAEGGVTLCGVLVPHPVGLAGHSDADVALHALTDALLGALGAGDIGEHFPPSDPQWRGAASSIFLAYAGNLVRDRGGVILHLDVTIVCERPKVGPHRAAMVARIADILGIAPERVSVKATTTERLGFTGREEGIAAQAVATIRV